MSTETATAARKQFVDDLRASVRDFRNPHATEQEREAVRTFWASTGLHIPNQFAALLRAAELDAGEVPKLRKP